MGKNEYPMINLATEDIIIYDWLSVSSKIMSVQSMLEFLGLQELPFQIISGFYGYRQRYYYDGISVHFDGHNEDMGILLEMSGQGCRVFETFGHGDWERLFAEFTSEGEGYNITRLDVAYDDHTGTLDLEKIAELTQKGLYLAKAKKWTVQNGSDGITVYIGSMKSETLIRFYDKARERGFAAEDGVHWVRCEIQLRHERASNFVKLNRTIGEKFGGVLNNYLRFVDENPNDPHHKHRWNTSEWWINFVKTVEKISIYSKKDIEYNLSRVERFIFRQCGNSIDTYIKCMGVDYFLKKLDERDSRLQERHRAIIDQYRQNSDVHQQNAPQT